MLIFPLRVLPMLPRGKGNKIINIPSKRVQTREEFLTHMALIPEGGTLTIQAGKRHFSLGPKTLSDFRGERGRRGRKLPRGLRNVDIVTVDPPKQGSLLLQ